MHSQLPAILRCTYCGREGLSLETETPLNENDQIVSGAVICPRCGSRYPVEDGIVNFLPRRVKGISPVQRSNNFRLVAWGYERLWRPKALSALGGREWLPAEELATINRMLETPEPERMAQHNGMIFYLDLGCSTCFYARAIARAIQARQLPVAKYEIPAHVVGVDNSWQMLQEARGFIEREGLSRQISLVRADVEQLPFIEGAFEGIASGGSLNEFRHTARALEEARRAVASRGRMAFMVQMQASHNPGQLINRALSLASGVHFFRPEQLNDFFQRAGFKVSEQQGSGLITISQLTPIQGN